MQNTTTHFTSYFLSFKLIDMVIMTFVYVVLVIFSPVVFITFVDILSVAFIISSHTLNHLITSNTTIHFIPYFFCHSNLLTWCAWHLFSICVNTYHSRIPNITFFARIIFLTLVWTFFRFIIPFFILIKSYTFEFTFTITWNIFNNVLYIYNYMKYI